MVAFSSLPTIIPLSDGPLTFELSFPARYYEADIVGHINNSVYMDWLEEAIHSALAEIPSERLPSQNDQQSGQRAFLQRGTAA